MQGSSASLHSVILPMLIIQVQGYVLGLISIILLICGIILNFLNNALIIIIVIVFIHTILSIMISIIAGYISNKR